MPAHTFRIAAAAAGLLLSSLAVAATGAEHAGPLTDRLDAIVDGYRDVHGFSGSVRVRVDDALVQQRSVGLAERSFGIPHRADTRGSINSISKTFTAVAALRLAERGELALDAPVSRYLAGFDAPWAGRVTVHQLLSHSAGLPREAGLDSDSALSLTDQLPYVARLEPRFEPGTAFGYSNAGYILLGNVLEAVSGLDFAALIEREVIAPLGLQDTGMYAGRGVVVRQAVPYRFGPDGVVEAQRTKTLGESAGGGLYSTTADLERFVLALEDDTLLSADGRARLFAAHAGAGEAGHEGYAWSIKRFGPATLRFSAGSGYGTKSVVVRDPDGGLSIVILSNWGNTPILDLLRDLFLAARGEAVEPPDSAGLARPDELADRFGRYRFDAKALRTALQAEDGEMRLHAHEGRVFLDDELLARKGDGRWGLTYTDELEIRFLDDRLELAIDGRRLVGRRID